MSYKKALKKLESLPAGERQLAAGCFVKSITRSGKPHCGCSVGKVLSQKDRLKLIRAQKKALMKAKVKYMWSNPNESGAEGLAKFLGLSVDLSVSDRYEKPFLCGMTFSETDRLIGENDAIIRCPETKENTKAMMVRRYKMILKWLRTEIETDS